VFENMSKLPIVLASVLLAALSLSRATPEEMTPPVVRNYSTPRLIRVGYTTFAGPAEVLAKKTSLESFTKYLAMMSAASSADGPSLQPLEFDIHLGNYYQIVSWLESKDLDAAVVSPFMAALLREQGAAVPVVEFSGHPPALAEAPHVWSYSGHWPLIASSACNGRKCSPLEDYARYLGELLEEAREHPNECREEASWRKYQLKAVAHLSTTGFIAPVLYAAHWLESQRRSDSSVEDRFWECFFDNVTFTLAHPQRATPKPARSAPRTAIKTVFEFTYSGGSPDPAKHWEIYGLGGETGQPPIPNDVLMVSSDHADLLAAVHRLVPRTSELPPLDPGDAWVPLLSQPEDYTWARPFIPALHRDFEDRVAKLLRNEVLKARFAQWYGQGQYDFSIADVAKFIRQDQEISGKAHLTLVLPGGGVKSAYQAEMLDRLYGRYLVNAKSAVSIQPAGEDRPLVVADVAGTSGGAMVGLFTAQKRASGDGHSLHVLWEPSPTVFPPFDMLRWASLYVVLLLFLLLFYLARILKLLDLDSLRESGSPKSTPYWLSLLLLGILLAGPFLVIWSLGRAGLTETPWGEGLLYLSTVVAIYVGGICCVEDKDRGREANPRSLLAPSTVTLLLAVVLLAVSIQRELPLATSLGVLAVVIGVIFLAREHKLGLRLAGLEDCLRTLAVLASLLVVSYSLLGLLILASGWATFLEVTGRFWITLLLSGLAVSIACLLAAQAPRQGILGHAHRGISHLATVHRFGRIRVERAQSLFLLFGLGLVWWNFVAAPAIYSSRSALSFFASAVHDHSHWTADKRLDLQTNLIVTATALENVPAEVEVRGSKERLPLPAGDIYFCFPGGPGGCPKAVESKRWIQKECTFGQVVDPVFASGSPFPVFPPHPALLNHAKALLVDGGYAHDVPLQAASLAGAHQALIIRSEPLDPPAEHRPQLFPSQLARYSGLLVPFMYQQAQEIDRSVARGMMVVSLSPYARDRKFPWLTDFSRSTIREMIDDANQDFDLDRRIGSVESWGSPIVFQRVRRGKTIEMFRLASKP
jgi:predicted acylesterase/phospholipase RssA/uncharacterized membrane protein